MLDPRTLRGRLTLGYAVAVVAALIGFAVVTLIVVDTIQRRDLDAELATTAHADASIVDVSRNDVALDAADRVQFTTIAATRVTSALFDAEGDLVVSSAYFVPVAISAGVLSGAAPHYATVTSRGDRLRVLFVPLLEHGRRLGGLAVWRDVESIDQLDRRIAVAFAFAIPLIAAVATLGGSAIARRGLQPLDRIVALASEIEGRDLSRRLGLPRREDELGRLAATFDRMLARLQRAFERERRFTADASHELRAPLSVILAEADLALMEERDPAQYRRALETIAIEAGGLEELTQRLLAVARADEAQLPAAQPVELDEIAANVVARLRPLARQRSVVLRQAGDGVALASADADELERALLTVVHNAVKYTRAGGTVTVRAAADGELATIEVRDEGSGFSADALVYGFERFWRDPASSEAGGTGLGLSLAQAIVERYGGTIALANAPGGALVTLAFPAQPPDGASSS